MLFVIYLKSDYYYYFNSKDKCLNFLFYVLYLLRKYVSRNYASDCHFEIKALRTISSFNIPMRESIVGCHDSIKTYVILTVLK